jgi:hypothetical protein
MIAYHVLSWLKIGRIIGKLGDWEIRKLPLV